MAKYLWTTYCVSDMQKTVEFYKELIGLRVVSKIEIPNHTILFLGSGEERETLVEIMEAGSKDDLAHSKTISLGFGVENLDETIEKAKAMNLDIIGPIEPNEHIRFCFVFDPDGVKIQLAEQK